MTKYYLLYILLACFPGFLFAQFSDDFSNDLSNWQGMVDDFTINTTNQLQLDASTAGESFIYTTVNLPDSLFWEVFLEMDFAPSSNNNLTIYLQLSEPDISTADGYFLQIGENGSDDAIELYRLDEGSEVLLAVATTGAVSSNPATARIRIERNPNSDWTLLADYTGGNSLNTEFTVNDDNYESTNGQIFGFFCDYTSSNVDNFVFDDVVIAELLPDVTPPVLLSANPLSANQLTIAFDEAVDTAAALNTANYTINNGIGNPAALEFVSGSQSTILATLSTPLFNNDNFELTAENITDNEGNIASSQSAIFSFFQPDEAAAFDILINEILADPTPNIGLPAAEYIELYNRSDKIIDLEDFGFSNGGSPKFLPAYILQPDSYVIVTDEDDMADFEEFGDVIGIDAFPALSNGGDDLTLTDPFDNIIHFVNYDLSWYGDTDKTEGGYSLELISPFNICEGQNNWQGSNNSEGGTPGSRNSVFQNITDTQAPLLINGYVSQSSPNEIKLFFNEIINQSTVENVDNYAIDPAIDIESASLLFPDQNAVLLQLESDLLVGTTYEITLSTSITDCNGNAIGVSRSTQVAVPENIAEGDILVNEILFNPAVGGSDYLELYNASSKTFDLSDLVIRNAVLLKAENGSDSLAGVSVALTEEVLFPPSTFFALTPAPTFVLDNYEVPRPDWLIETDLPAFANDEGNVKITTGELLETIFIDSVNYSEDWHHPLLDDEEGVSLERINFTGTSDDADNWHSAASTAGFGTPTGPNSQAINQIPDTEDMFTLINSTFSPDGDGFKDFLQINYVTDQNGFVANASIFDATGRKVIDLFRSELLGATGSFKWDGSISSGERARIGIYVLWIEIFSPSGDIREEKKTIVIGGEL